MNLFKNAQDARSVPAGAIICHKGDAGETMFAVSHGEVEVVLEGRVIETFGEGQIFGEMALIDKSPRTADVRAKTDCAIVEIDERRFLFLVQQTPFFALEVMRTLTTRLRHRLAESG